MRPFVPRGDRPGGVGNVAKGGANNDAQDRAVHAYRDTCGKCGARRIDSQLGLEPTPEHYVENMVAVFREVRRVLRDDGTLWLNLGDSYASNGNGGDTRTGFNARYFGKDYADGKQVGHGENRASVKRGALPAGLKPKDLVGIPWAVAFALRADGWYLRDEIIWAKGRDGQAGMPGSQKDRCTRSHEQIFMLTKRARYFYDHEAIREPSVSPEQEAHSQRYAQVYDGPSTERENGQPGNVNNGGIHSRPGEGGRTKRTVWNVSTTPFPGAHFATFPPKLIEPCILAGSRPRGAMIEPEVIATPLGERNGDDPSLRTGRAGMNRPRHHDEGTRSITVAEQRTYAEQLKASPHREAMASEAGEAFAHYLRTDTSGARPIPPDLLAAWIERGWLAEAVRPEAISADPSTATVLDPFAGSGTTGVVALRHDRDFIGIELNETYAEMARRRIYDDAPLFNHESATLGALQPVRPEAALERVRKAWKAEECDRLEASADPRSSVPRSTENAPATQERPGAEPRGVSS